MLIVNTMGIAMLSATAPTTLLNITPGEIRGQVIALYYIVISLAGLLLGPTTVGLLTDHVFGTDGLRYSVALLPGAVRHPGVAHGTGNPAALPCRTAPAG